MSMIVSSTLQNLASIKFAVDRTLLVGGYEPHKLDFYNSIWGRYLTASPTVPEIPVTASNASCTSNSCRIFHQDGGGVTPFTIPLEVARGGGDASSWSGVSNNGIYPTHIAFRTIQIQNVGTSEPELVAFMSGLGVDFCVALNEALEIEVSGSVPTPVDNPGSLGIFSGTLSSFPPSSGILGDQDINLAGRNAFCYRTNAGGTEHFFVYVLIER